MNVIRISEVVLPDSGLSGLFMSSHSHLIFEGRLLELSLLTASPARIIADDLCGVSCTLSELGRSWTSPYA